MQSSVSKTFCADWGGLATPPGPAPLVAMNTPTSSSDSTPMATCGIPKELPGEFSEAAAASLLGASKGLVFRGPAEIGSPLAFCTARSYCLPNYSFLAIVKTRFRRHMNDCVSHVTC